MYDYIIINIRITNYILGANNPCHIAPFLCERYTLKFGFRYHVYKGVRKLFTFYDINKKQYYSEIIKLFKYIISYY